jgi:hypothetical protein
VLIDTPIAAIDIDGLEEQIAIDGSTVTGPVDIQTKGLRFVDGFGVTDDGIRIAVESKVGRTSLSEFVQKQIAKDAELLATGEVDQVIWRFAKSPKTGKVGPTAPLREALQKEGIKILEVQ